MAVSLCLSIWLEIGVKVKSCEPSSSPAPIRQNDCPPKAGLHFDLAPTGGMEVADRSHPEWTFRPTAAGHFCRVALAFGSMQVVSFCGTDRRSAA